MAKFQIWIFTFVETSKNAIKNWFLKTFSNRNNFFIDFRKNELHNFDWIIGIYQFMMLDIVYRNKNEVWVCDHCIQTL